MISTFIKLPFVINIFVWSISKWLLKTGFTVHQGFYFFHLNEKTLSHLPCTNQWKDTSQHPHVLRQMTLVLIGSDVIVACLILMCSET